MTAPPRKLTLERTLSVSVELDREDPPRSDMLWEAATQLSDMVDMGHLPGPTDSWLIILDEHGWPTGADDDHGHIVRWDGDRLTWVI